MSQAIQVGALDVVLRGHQILDAVSLSVTRGEWLAIIGPNGAGKSTLLRTLAGIVDAVGEVYVDGIALRRLGPRELARRVALVPQQPQIPQELTVAEYVLLGRTPHIGYFGRESGADRIAAERAVLRLGLRTFAARTLGSLSGGEMQRAVLARALAQEAAILLLDEPTSALDLGRQQLALELVDRLRRESGLTVVSAMHDLTLAGQFAERLVLLDMGRVAAQGTAAEVLRADVIGAHYAAEVRTIQEDGGVFVLPQRRVSQWVH